MDKYELTVIVRPNLEEKLLAASWGKITDLITSLGGKVTGEDIWGKRRFTYRMKTFSEGVYAVLALSLPRAKITDLKRRLGLENDVLRFLLVKKFA